MTISDPMRDGAVFNQPLDDTSLLAKDFPMFENATTETTPGLKDRPVRSTSSTSLALSRTSSDSRVSVIGPAVEASSSNPLKRQPRKLTKSRGNSDTNIERRDAEKAKARINSDTAIEKLSSEKLAERPKGLLTKRSLHHRSSSATNLVEEGQKSDSTLLAVKDDTPKGGATPQQPSSLRDRLFPG